MTLNARLLIYCKFRFNYNKDKAKRLPHSTFDVERSMFDVQIISSEITTERSYYAEITYTGQEF
jgi:hypothetical protein